VDCGKHDFENEHLKFHHELEECFLEHRPDTILFSSVLQYLERPYSLLGKVRSLGFEFLLFDRTTFIESGRIGSHCRRSRRTSTMQVTGLVFQQGEIPGIYLR